MFRLLQAASANTTGIAIISLVFIIGAYLLCFGLWFFVFRRGGDRDRKNQGGPDEAHPASSERRGPDAP